MFQGKVVSRSTAEPHVVAVVLVILTLVLIGGSVDCISANFSYYAVPKRDLNGYYIEVDGSVTPSDAPIRREGNTYVLTQNINNHSLWIQCDDVVFDGAGFCLLGSNNPVGLTVNSTKNVTVKNLMASGFTQGIVIERERYPEYSMSGVYQPNPYSLSKNNVISNCTLTNNDYGITVTTSAGNSLCGNRISKSATAGIMITSGTEISANTISENDIRDNNVGVRVEGSSQNAITKNNISSNTDWGIILLSASQNKIAENIIQDNKGGILVDESTNNEIKENTITENNGWGMRLERGQSNNLIVGNNFVNNKVGENLQISIPLYFGVHTPGNYTAYAISGLGNIWSEELKGNYWSDYATRYMNASQVSGATYGNTPYFINVFRQYPPKKHVPIEQAGGWVSEKQHRYVMAAINDGRIAIPYERTQTLAKGWKQIGSGAQSILVNETPYADLVMGNENQTRMMQIIGWKRVSLILSERYERAVKIADGAASKAIKNLGL